MLYLDLKESSKVYVFYASKAIVKDQSRPSYMVIYRLIFYVQIVARFSECCNRGTLIILLSILSSSSQEEFLKKNSRRIFLEFIIFKLRTVMQTSKS